MCKASRRAVVVVDESRCSGCSARATWTGSRHGRECVVAVKSYVGGSRSWGREIMSRTEREGGIAKSFILEKGKDHQAREKKKMSGSGEERGWKRRETNKSSVGR